MTLTPDQERWAEAIAIYRQHGTKAGLWLAGRVEELARAGDAAGVTRFLEIATRLDQLLHPGSVQ